MFATLPKRKAGPGRTELTEIARALILNHMVDYLSMTFRALADPTRRAILAALIERQSATIKDLSAPYPMSLTAFSKHVQVLERAGLVHRRKIGRENHLTPNPNPLVKAGNWIEFSRAHWNARFADLEAALEADIVITKSEKKRKKR